MQTLRKAEDRGHANHGWLDSYNSFSFADYYDPDHVSYGPLRVINEDRVQAGAGFGTLTAEEKTTYADTWYAYYGRFEIDEAESRVRHFIEGSLFAFETGMTLVRTVRLVDGVLTLRTVDLLKGPDGETFNQLTWTRI